MQNRNARWAVGIGLLTLALTVAWLVPVLDKYEWDALTLVGIGTAFSEGLQPDAEAYTRGYDGQFAYFIATRGFNADPFLDVPTYRYQRILYPALVGLISLVNPDLAPWVMLGVNLIAHSAGAGLLAYLLARLGGRAAYALYALVYSLWVGQIVGVHLDLNEPLTMAIAMAGLVLFYHERVRWAAMCFALAALTKDLGLVMVTGVALYMWFAGRRRDSFTLGLSAGGAYAAWTITVRLTVGWPGEAVPLRFSVIPLFGLEATLGVVELVMILVWLVIPAVVWGALAVRTLLRHQGTLTAWVMVCCALFVVYIPPETYMDFAATMRVGVPAMVAILLYAVQHHPRKLPVMVIIWLPTLITVAYLPGFVRG